MFCGVLRVFCGVLRVFFEKQCFAVFCGCFAMFWTCFCFVNVFCRHFLSVRERRTAPYCAVLHKAYFVRFVRFVYFLVCFVLFFVKNAKNTHTKHRKTPQNTAKHCFLKKRDPLRGYVTPPVIRNLRVLRIVYFCDRSKVFLKTNTPNARNTYCGCNATVL